MCFLCRQGFHPSSGSLLALFVLLINPAFRGSVTLPLIDLPLLQSDNLRYIILFTLFLIRVHTNISFPLLRFFPGYFPNPEKIILIG